MKPLRYPGGLFVLALYAAGLLGCLALWLAPGPIPPATPTVDGRPPDNRRATATPTKEERPPLTPVAPTPTADHRPPAATETATMQPPTPAATATPRRAAPTSTPILTATPVMACRTGVITAHAAMAAVLANRPERRCAGCTYFASVLCQELGETYTLYAGGQVLTITAVDCADWTVGKWPQKQGQDWLGELDIDSWPEGEPLAPLEAKLCKATRN